MAWQLAGAWGNGDRGSTVTQSYDITSEGNLEVMSHASRTCWESMVSDYSLTTWVWDAEELKNECQQSYSPGGGMFCKSYIFYMKWGIHQILRKTVFYMFLVDWSDIHVFKIRLCCYEYLNVWIIPYLPKGKMIWM